MGQITSLYVHKVLAETHTSLDRRALLASIGLDADAPIDPKLMVDAGDYYALLERIAERDPDALDLPLRVGASMLADEYGAFGLAWKSALTLRGSLERLERYGRVLTSVARFELQDVPGGALMCLFRDGIRRPGLHMSNENSIASIAAMCEQVSTGTFHAQAVYFSHAAPTTAAHERHFGCPVHFDADRDALLIDADVLALPNRLGDASIVQFFDRHLGEEISGLTAAPSLERRVRELIAPALSEGVPRVSTIASRLGMSTRSLQRRLADDGCAFQVVVDDARRELAQRLLRETEYPLAEIAFLTGFSEQSAFNRAFRRWSGQTPRSYRIARVTSPR